MIANNTHATLGAKLIYEYLCNIFERIELKIKDIIVIS